VIVVRFLWVYPATYLPRMLSRSVRDNDPAPSWREPFIIAFTGVRGVVSLAAALSVPALVAGNVPFPGRDKVLVVTFVVILVTLVAQGLTLPLVVRWLGLVDAGLEERHARLRQEANARLEVARAALGRLDKAAAQFQLPKDLLGKRRERLCHHILQLEAAQDPEGAGIELAWRAKKVELQLIDEERRRLNALLREGRITDDVRRRIERDLDLDEERLRRNVRGVVPDEEPDPDPVVATR
jgi:hypothetical protein